MANEWNIANDGVNYKISYKQGFGASVIVNGEKRKLKSKSMWIMLLDEEISLGSKTAHLVVIGSKVDLAVDDRYMGSGEAYIPLSKLPPYSNIMCIVAIIWGFFFNGWMGIAIALLISTIIMRNALKAAIVPQGEMPDKSILIKCLLLTIASMVITACLGMFFTTLLNG